MSQLACDRGVAKCGGCNGIHTVEVENDGSIRVLGIGVVDQCPSCGDGELTVLSADLETPPVPDSATTIDETARSG